jgi:hypothetical protein
MRKGWSYKRVIGKSSGKNWERAVGNHEEIGVDPPFCVETKKLK